MKRMKNVRRRDHEMIGARFLLSLLLMLPSIVYAGGDNKFFHTTEKVVGVISQEDASKVTVIFDFQNRTGHIVAINEVRKTCGCETVSYPKHPIQKNEKGSIKVTLDLEDYKGSFHKSVFVLSEGLDPVRLRIKGVIK